MKYPSLNLPNVDLKIKLVNEITQVFCQVRKKYFILTHEEWVRQHFIFYLSKEKRYPLSLMSVEKVIKYNNINTRADIVIYNIDGSVKIIVECKAPTVNITEDVLLQIFKYNAKLQAIFLVLTNGLSHYCCEVDYHNKCTEFIESIPAY
tara:strand:+ start:42 stop:488 length:447 start_codon:yes stop_codon:yes gene_type:complete